MKDKLAHSSKIAADIFQNGFKGILRCHFEDMKNLKQGVDDGQQLGLILDEQIWMSEDCVRTQTNI